MNKMGWEIKAGGFIKDDNYKKNTLYINNYVRFSFLLLKDLSYFLQLDFTIYGQSFYQMLLLYNCQTEWNYHVSYSQPYFWRLQIFLFGRSRRNGIRW